MERPGKTQCQLGDRIQLACISSLRSRLRNLIRLCNQSERISNPVRPSPVKIYRSAAIDVGDVDVRAKKGTQLFAPCPLSVQRGCVRHVLSRTARDNHLFQLTDLSKAAMWRVIAA